MSKMLSLYFTNLCFVSLIILLLRPNTSHFRIYITVHLQFINEWYDVLSDEKMSNHLESCETIYPSKIIWVVCEVFDYKLWTFQILVYPGT